MVLRDFANQTANEIRPRKLWVSWIQGVIVTGIFAVAGRLSQADPFVLLATGSLVLIGSAVLLQIAKQKWVAWLVVWAVALSSCVVIALNVHRARVKADNYQLTYNGIILLKHLGKDPSGQPQIDRASFRIYVYNPNDFPVYYSIERRFGRIEKQATSLHVAPDEAAEIDELKAHESAGCETDDMNVALTGLRHYDGEIDCVIKFGKSKEKLDKDFEFARKVRFLLCPDVRETCDLGFPA